MRSRGVHYAIAKIDPHSGRVLTTFPVDRSDSWWITDVGIGLGAIWVATHGYPGKFHKIDLSTQKLVASAELPSKGFFNEQRPRLAIGEEAVWVTAGNQLFRLDPLTAQSAARNELDADAYGRPMVTRGGAVWVAKGRGIILIWIDPQTNSVVQSIPIKRGWGYEVTTAEISASADWGVLYGGKLSRVDLQTGQIVEVALPVKVSKVIAAGDYTVRTGLT